MSNVGWLPTRAELLGLLTAGGPGAARSCAASDACAALFGTGEGPLWTSDVDGDAAWTVTVADGSSALVAPRSAARVRCVRTEPR